MTIPFVQARNYTRGRIKPIELVVIHDMEYPENLDAAEKVAQFFAGQKPSSSTGSSAHYCVDTDSVVQCVHDNDTAWHAPGANANGLGIEHAGYASQRLDQWTDAYSTAELHVSAKLVAGLCDKYGIPKRYVAPADLLMGERGITTHAAVSQAFHKSDHTDPGPNFPMSLYLAMVADPDPHPAPTGGTVPASNAPFAAILVHPPTGGYLEIGEDGGVWAWGGAPFFGSMGGTQLNQPIVDAAWTPDFGGYYLIGRDGGIFAFGNARNVGNALWSG